MFTVVFKTRWLNFWVGYRTVNTFNPFSAMDTHSSVCIPSDISVRKMDTFVHTLVLVYFLQ